MKDGSQRVLVMHSVILRKKQRVKEDVRKEDKQRVKEDVRKEDGRGE
jgi:hypothetical protein